MTREERLRAYDECHRLHRVYYDLRKAARIPVYLESARIWDPAYLRAMLARLQDEILTLDSRHPPDLLWPLDRARAAAAMSVRTGMSVAKCRRRVDSLPR